MQSAPQPELDPHLARAVAHPTRRAILELLIGQKGLSPRSLAETLEVGAANARYHVDVLQACGAIELVQGEGRRGERLVRLARARRTKDQRRLDPSGSMRDDVSEAQLKSLIETAADLFPPGYDVRGA